MNMEKLMSEEQHELLSYKFDIELILGLTKDLMSKIELGGFQNEQWFLNFLDELNKLSVKH